MNGAEMVVCPELSLGYVPATGELFRLDAHGQVKRQLKTWREKKAEGRLAVMPVYTDELGYMPATHVIWRIMTGNWPGRDMVIDHRNRRVNDTRWHNLRLATVGQNNLNRSMETRRVNGVDEGLETGVRKMPSGYQVIFRGKHYRTFKTKEEANPFARELRKRLNGEWDRGQFMRRI
jgi:hypothetical protein